VSHNGASDSQNLEAVTAYTLRRIPTDLWKKVRSRAAYEGRTMRFVLLELLRVYAKHGFRIVETFDDARGGE
jgi:hypothetical protein